MKQSNRTSTKALSTRYCSHRVGDSVPRWSSRGWGRKRADLSGRGVNSAFRLKERKRRRTHSSLVFCPFLFVRETSNPFYDDSRGTKSARDARENFQPSLSRPFFPHFRHSRPFVPPLFHPPLRPVFLRFPPPPPPLTGSL